MPADAEKGREPIKHFEGGNEQQRAHLNLVVDAVNEDDARLKAVERLTRKYTPLVLFLVDSGDLVEFEVFGMRIGDQAEQELSV